MVDLHVRAAEPRQSDARDLMVKPDQPRGDSLHRPGGRRGRVERREGLFLHFCIDCGAWGAYGYGVPCAARSA